MNDQSMNKKNIVFVSDYLTTLEIRSIGNIPDTMFIEQTDRLI